MEPVVFAKQMIDFNKTTFDNAFNSMVMLQEQTERTVNTFLEQTPWLPEDGKKVLDHWVKTYKKGRDDFKKAVDQNFKTAEALFVETGKTEKAKTKKTPEA